MLSFLTRAGKMGEEGNVVLDFCLRRLQGNSRLRKRKVQDAVKTSPAWAPVGNRL